MASSEYSSNHTAQHSRLNANNCWSPTEETGPGTWIRADLGTKRLVVAIRTRGGLNYFVTQFMLTISPNGGSDWSHIADETG